jgi:hypothetical protein
MRAVRIALAGLVGLAGALIGAPAAFAAGASLTLSPAHGAARSTFTVTYHYSGFANGFCPLGRFAGVVFAWDGNRVGQSQLNRQTCSVQVRMRPPRNDRGGGLHTVTAAIPAVAGSRADSTYTIDTAAPSPTAAPAGQQTQDPASTGPTAGDPATGGPAALPPASVAGSAATQAAANVQPSWLGWALVFGAALVLAGAGTFGFVIVRSRRERMEY